MDPRHWTRVNVVDVRAARPDFTIPLPASTQKSHTNYISLDYKQEKLIATRLSTNQKRGDEEMECTRKTMGYLTKLTEELSHKVPGNTVPRPLGCKYSNPSQASGDMDQMPVT